MSEPSKFYTVCTKCGHCESSEILLSRFCPRCGYMRGVRKVGETDEQGKERDETPLTDEERLSLFIRKKPPYRPKPPLWVPQ